jgi:folate-binding protein YgfZ
MVAKKSERASSEQLAPPQVVGYRGVLTPAELDARQRETAALLAGAAVHDLGWLRRVAVGGEDRFRWLSGMVTNTVNDLGTNAGAWNLILNAQGRIQGDLHVWREGESLELEIAADQSEKLLAHLDRFIIMDDVELTPLRNESALELTGPQAADLLARLELPAPPEPLTSARAAWKGGEILLRRTYGLLVPHYELWVHVSELPALWQALTEAGATPVGANSLEAFRIAEGIPAYGIDIIERDLPQEAIPQARSAAPMSATKSEPGAPGPLHLEIRDIAGAPGPSLLGTWDTTTPMRASSKQLAAPQEPQVAISFNKGCYMGQEIVERIRSRGSVHRHLRPLEFVGPIPAAGTELKATSGAVAGAITSAAELPLLDGSRIFALGMIRSEAELSPQPFTYTTEGVAGTARILTSPPVF